MTTDTKKTLLNCTYYGVYSLTQTKKVTVKEERVFMEQFLYSYYNDPATLTEELSERMEKSIKEGMFHPDEDHKGFIAGNGRELNVANEIRELYRIFEDDKDFKDIVLKFGKMRDAFKFYGMKTNDFQRIYELAEEIEKTVPANSPMVMIQQNKLKEFFEDDTKTEFEIMTFAIYLGIKSILGKKRFCRTTKDMIIARAFGFRNMDELLQHPPELYEKYNSKKRYWIDKVFDELNSGVWDVYIFSTKKGLRGLYIGSGISRGDFEDFVAERLKKNDAKHMKKLMNQRIEEKVEKLKNDDFNNGKL